MSLGRGDPLEGEMSNHPSILAWEIPGTEETASPQGHKGSGTTEQVSVQNIKQDVKIPGLVEKL